MPICEKTVSVMSDEGRRVGLKRKAGHLALSRLDDAGAVGTDETGLVLAHQRVLHTNPACSDVRWGAGDSVGCLHVLLRNSFGDANNQGNFGIQSLENRGCGTRRRYLHKCITHVQTYAAWGRVRRRQMHCSPCASWLRQRLQKRAGPSACFQPCLATHRRPSWCRSW
jgi:hypothetical protein